MATFTEEQVIDSIRVDADGAIEVRRADRVLKDGVEISKAYHRHTLAPGSSLDNEDEKVAAVANTVWTPEVIAAWQAKQEV